MRIQHNIAALNSHRQLTSNNSAVAKNLEKLSSGYKINRAGDDAAGLAISEKMRAQITGLETAQKNAQDGISLVQTAEGALTEVHSMLNRMVELADQSANGTYDDSVDRANLQKELVSLRSEIDRIAEGTNFNGINLLDGNLGGPKMSTTPGVKSVAGGAASSGTGLAVSDATSMKQTAVEGEVAVTAKVTVDLAGMKITAPTDGSTGGKVTFTIGGQAVEVAVTTDMDDKAIRTALVGRTIVDNGVTLTAKAGSNDTEIVFEAAAPGVTTGLGATDGTNITTAVAQGDIGGGGAVTGSATTMEMDFDGRTGADLLGGTMKVGGKTYVFVDNASAAAAAASDGKVAVTIAKDDSAASIASKIAGAMTGQAAVSGFTASASGNSLVLSETAVNNAYAGVDAPKAEFSGVGLTLQIGDTADSFNQLTVSVNSMSAQSLGLDTIDISTQSGAKAAIDKIKTAINTVSSTRGDLGAIQNRLEHTINNLSVTTENMTAAESRIRDVDMAEEMMAYTKNNILVQASQAMLAQANQLPQGVLQLLQ